MKHGLAAAAAAIAMVLGGCSASEPSTKDNSNVNSPVSELQANLTLPNGTVINSINYTVSGSLLPLARSGVVNLANSTQLRFRVGNLPVGPGYTMALAGTTVAGESCAGTAGFTIADNLVTTLTMTLVCGSGVVAEVDANGDVSVSVEVVNEAGVVCPVVTGISALPLEVTVGSSLLLQGFTSSGTGASFAWAGPGGTFSAATSAASSYLCTDGGDHTLTFGLTKPGCSPSTAPVTVTCTGGTVVDAGVDSAVPDSAVPDSSVVDSSVPPVPDTCVTCVTAETSPCRTFQDVGVDFPATCLDNPDPAFAQLCTDAYECSIQDPGLCAGDLTRGAISCYCGLTQTLDACFATPSATNGPKGPCIAQWEAASGCAVGDFACVSDNFVNTDRPSAYAAFLTSCTVTDCAPSCALPRPSNVNF